ncbi:MAG: hypothetical protein RUMPE_00707 [Eubacteriales bacterium SKADARSKE-1]|nr:hypothetical protein [Eubacteriales bacterium SKADARSKE-1]
MKKVLSSVLTITMLISTIGPASVFADGSESNDSSVASTKSYVGLAKDYVVSKAKSAIKEVSENKSKYAIIAGGAILSAAAAVAAMYYCKGSNNALDVESSKDGAEVSVSGTTDKTAIAATGKDEQELSTEVDVCLPGEENICFPIDKDYNDGIDLSQSQPDISAPSLKYDEISNVETNAKNASAIAATGNDEQALNIKANVFLAGKEADKIETQPEATIRSEVSDTSNNGLKDENSDISWATLMKKGSSQLILTTTTRTDSEIAAQLEPKSNQPTKTIFWEIPTISNHAPSYSGGTMSQPSQNEIKTLNSYYYYR